MTVPITFNAGLTPTKVANMALSKLGLRSTIGSLSENSPEAAQCSLWYKLSLAQTLEAYNWNFARARRDLELYTDVDGNITFGPPVEWQFRYQVHPSVLVARYLENPLGPYADAIPFTIEFNADGTKSILTNIPCAKLVYTIDVTDDQFVALYPGYFINAFTSCLASNIAFSLTGSMPMQQSKVQEFLFLVKAGSAIDGNSTVDSKPREAEAIRGRD